MLRQADMPEQERHAAADFIKRMSIRISAAYYFNDIRVTKSFNLKIKPQEHFVSAPVL